MSNTRYTPGDIVIVAPRGSRPYPARIIADYGTDLVEVATPTGKQFPARSIVTLADSHLSRNEAPAPANAVYRGVMQERLERRR